MKFKIGNVQIFPNNYYFDFMHWRRFTVGLSVLLVALSIIIIALKGLNYSIDFLGGTEVQVNLTNQTNAREQITQVLEKNGVKHFELTTFGNISSRTLTPALSSRGLTTGSMPPESYVIRIQREKNQNEDAVSNHTDVIVKSLKSHFGNNVQIASVTNISGKVGKEDEHKGYWALIVACIGILLYIAVRFDARFAPGAVLCLIHNVIIALGFMTLLGRPFTTASIAAFLTIVGYTINDTVIVYDRIRETRILQPKLPLIEVVNRSISQTMNRTVLTSATGILALLVLSILGGGTIEDFAITMLVGIVVGTYSSIYVAAPLTLMMDRWFEKLGLFKNDQKPKIVKNTDETAKDYAPPIRLRKK